MKKIALLPFAFCLSSAASADLLISQYIEGSSNNKAIELYNTSDSAVDLGEYTLSFYFNGSTSAGTVIELSGSLAAGQTYIIADDSADGSITALANLNSSHSFFNGDDAIILKAGSQIIDSLGQLGVDPGSQWGSGLTSTQDNTLIRLESVASGDTDPSDSFDPATEFRGLEKDDFSGLGEHTYTPTDGGGDGDTGGEDGDLAGVCTNCPALDKVADASTFDPAIYYSAVQSEIDAGSDVSILRQRISETLASGHRQLTYSQVWTALTETDEDPANSDNVILFYSNRSLAKASNGSGSASSNPDNWNREHSWPKSHGFSGTSNEAYTDIQHLRATDISVNGSRASLDFDYSDAPLAEAPENRVDGDSFEPRDAIKGDVARMMMYMDVRYEGSSADITPDLMLVNRLTSGDEAALGKLCVLLEWHNNDPVDNAELTRQNTIYEYQGNRNPFVDHPDWAALLYPASSCEDSEPTEPPTDPDPSEPAAAASLMLTAIFDGPLSGGVPKGIELLVTQDTDDLSVCGVGSANNGGGSSGEEFVFPAVSARAGDYIYIASEADGFTSFFGFAPDYTSNAMSINGDDAVEVFCHGELIDIYGDANTDGTGEAWEYTDSFAYRNSGSASVIFEVSNWQVPGTDTLDGQTSNSSATTPIPVGTYALTPATLFFSEYVEGSSFNKALELVNVGGTEIDLSEYAVQVFANGNTTGNSIIALSGSLAAGGVYVLANDGADTAITAVANALTGEVNFNGDDAVVLLQNGEIVDAIGQIGVRTEWGSGDTSTKDNTLRRKAGITSGDSNAFDTFDPAFEWDGFANNSFDNLGRYGDATGGGSDDSLGVCADEATYIHTVQGAESASALAGKTVVVEGVVTHITPALSGYFVQEEAADTDNDENTSEGIFVKADGSELKPGDVVRVLGSVEEQYGRTQLVAQQDPLLCGSGTVVPVVINLPKTAQDSFEAVEGMLVTNATDWIINNVYNYGSYGEVAVSSQRLYVPTQLYGSDSEEAAALSAANALDQVLIDDNSDGSDTTEHLLMPGEFGPYNSVRSGDTVTSVVGVMDYGFSAYRIRPVEVADVINSNARTEQPEIEPGSLRIASFNVLNLFNGDGEGAGFPTSRGADSFAEYQRQLDKIVAAMSELDADVIGLLELENDGFGQTSTLAQLTAAMNDAAGDERYAYVDANVTTIGSDEITSGIIYRQDKVTTKGGAAILSEANSIADENGPLFAWNNRPSLAQKFSLNSTGNEFVVDVNHFKSKGSSCGTGDDDPLGGNCNLTRTRAAIALTAWLAETYGDTPTVVVGDLNAYAQEDPIRYLTGAGFTDTLAQTDGLKTYSYTFQGAAGTLDYQLANAPMAQYLVDATVWHVNADESPALDYNSEYKPDSWLNTLVYRASDHDPVLATYQFALIGDWDGDNDVDYLDSRALLNAILRRQPIDDSFDINGDGKINTRDVAALGKLCTRRACATGETSNRGNSPFAGLFSR